MAYRTSGIDTQDPDHNLPPAGFDPNAGGTLLGHPKGLFLLFFVEMWERFSYYGMRALLVLYLINVIAVHQLKPGAYTNMLKFEEVAADGTTVTSSRHIPLHVLVGNQAATLPTAPAASGEPALVFERLESTTDSAGEVAWSLAKGIDPWSEVKVQGEPGAKGGFGPAETRWRIRNPTDKDVATRFDIVPDESDKRSYFRVNGRQGATFTATVKPDSAMTEADKPLEIIVSVNDHDSGRNWSQSSASTLYGWYTGLAYLLPIVGGLIADKLLGTHRSMLLGGVVIALGHILLGVSGFGEMAQNAMGLSVFVAGLATIIIGTGYFKPTVSTMVGQLYKPGDARRDGGFSIFYMGINLGAFLCAFVCGTLGEQVGWHWGFGAAAVGMLAGLFMYMIGKPVLLKGIGDPPPGKGNAMIPLFLGTVVVAGLVGWAHNMGFFGVLTDAVAKIAENKTLAMGLIIGGLCSVIIAVGWFVAIQKPGDKGPTFSIFLFMLFNAFFWIAFEQAGSSMNVFAEESTRRELFGFEFPATWFQSVNAGFIILFAPFFAAMWAGLGRRNMNPTQPMKIAWGLILLSLGFIFMVIGAKQAATGSLVSPLWLLAAYFLHTMGELCLSPTGLSYVTKAAPVRFVSLLMGIWFISSFIANLGGGLIAAQVEAIERGEIAMPWPPIGGRADFFALFVVVPGAVGLLVMLFTPLLKKLLRSQTD